MIELWHYVIKFVDNIVSPMRGNSIVPQFYPNGTNVIYVIAEHLDSLVKLIS